MARTITAVLRDNLRGQVLECEVVCQTFAAPEILTHNGDTYELMPGTGDAKWRYTYVKLPPVSTIPTTR